LEYFAFGETFVEEHSNTHRTPYLFNGKELDEETGLYYYGARYYDAQTSVWLSVDPLAEEAPGWSPYRFGFNNPIKFMDPDGNFEIDAQTARNNPKLAAYLKGLKDVFINKSDDFKQAFYGASGLTEEETIEMLTYGKGPKLEVENLDTDSKKINGVTLMARDPESGEGKNVNGGKGLIKLDDEVAAMLENSMTVGEEEVGTIMVESTLFHEGTHYGNLKKNGNGNGSYDESGKEFEKNAYGQDISRSGVRKYWESKQPKRVEPIKPDDL
jgi:RHS repeat-associated protein